jgi:hypothetical protein
MNILRLIIKIFGENKSADQALNFHAVKPSETFDIKKDIYTTEDHEYFKLEEKRISKISDSNKRWEELGYLDDEKRDRAIQNEFEIPAMKDYSDGMKEYWDFLDWVSINFDVDTKKDKNFTNYSFYPITTYFKIEYGGGEALSYTEFLQIVCSELGFSKEKSKKLLNDVLENLDPTITPFNGELG